MIAAKEKQDVYFASFAALEKKRAGDPAWLHSLRRAAIDRFGELGFPTTKHEDWKYTSLAALARVPFRPAETQDARGVKRMRPSYLDDCLPLVFVNGRLYPDPSAAPAALPAGVKVGSLAAGLSEGSDFAEQNLARYAPYQNQALVALNTAFVEDGALVEIANNVVVEKPVYLLYMSLPGQEASVCHPRTLIRVGRGSQVTVIEDYIVAGHEGVYFTNSVTELVAEEGAVVDYVRVERESAQAFHIASVQFHQGRSSTLHATSIQFGGSLVREDGGAVLGGEGCESTLNGLYVIGGKQHVDNHTTIDHAKPHCSSRELYKGVLDGQATGVFNGKIIVRQDAQKTDSKQSNKNLLLSEDAVINTKPQLEIFADDVRCTHGATVGQIDQEAVFYLRSRGIGLSEARSMLTQAFANDVITKIKFRPLRDLLTGELPARLAAGLRAEAANPVADTGKGRVSTLVEES